MYKRQIMSRLLLTLPINATFKSILCGVSEITSGTAIIFENISGNTVLCTYLILLFTVFGGISITMQSLSQICHSKLKVYYLVGKLESSVVFTLLLDVYKRQVFIICKDGLRVLADEWHAPDTTPSASPAFNIIHAKYI